MVFVYIVVSYTVYLHVLDSILYTIVTVTSQDRFLGCPALFLIYYRQGLNMLFLPLSDLFCEDAM